MRNTQVKHHPPEQEKPRKISLLRKLITVREADRREHKLFCQGRAQLHVSCAGHEGIAGMAALIEKDDIVYCYYRDKALVHAMGMPLYDMALDFFAKKGSGSDGRQMANHYTYKPLNIMPSASPTGIQCLPAVGSAWAIKKSKKSQIAFCMIGEAATRQGEFFEALAFALQENVPVVFVVEDNGYGISTPTENMTPLNLDMIPQACLHVMCGRDPIALEEELSEVIYDARTHHRPKVVWLKVDRLMPHTSSDDHRKYRTEDELLKNQNRDPIEKFKQRMINEEFITKSELALLNEEIQDEVRKVYEDAENAEDPDIKDIRQNIIQSPPYVSHSSLPIKALKHNEWRMSESVNYALKTLMAENERIVIFGEDIEDPKGGVFGLTKGLSEKYPDRVTNSPLAEATIAGLASGLSMSGYLPIFEMQFIDFSTPAFNQIVNQIATLRWRSAGKYSCPLILYAPCGGFISNGGPWHSQTNESWFSHAPGLKVYMPGNANDAANLFYHAAQGDDPTLILLPKNQFQKRVALHTSMKLHPEKANILRSGEHVTVIAWGNCIDLAMNAALQKEKKGISVEVIDVCSITPCDWATLHQSVRKTGRLVVVQEDNRSCSFGQAIISELLSTPETWNSMYAPPELVTREDVHIAFNAQLERATLPDTDQVIQKINLTLGEPDE